MALAPSPLKLVKAGRWTLRGYSRSTVATVVHVKELGVLFDLGACPPELVGVRDAFVSHCHLDHVNGAFVHAAQRTLRKMKPSRLHVPAKDAGAFRIALEAAQALERGRWAYQLVPLSAGQRVPLRGNLSVEAVATEHSVPSLGFLVRERRLKLRPEFSGLSGAEIAALKRSGAMVAREVDEPVLFYSGDTTEGVLSRPDVAAAECWVVECTFLDPGDEERAARTRHVHLDRLLEVVARPGCGCRHLVLTHFSQRYDDAEIAAHVEGARERLGPKASVHAL